MKYDVYLSNGKVLSDEYCHLKFDETTGTLFLGKPQVLIRVSLDESDHAIFVNIERNATLCYMKDDVPIKLKYENINKLEFLDNVEEKYRFIISEDGYSLYSIDNNSSGETIYTLKFLCYKALLKPSLKFKEKTKLFFLHHNDLKQFCIAPITIWYNYSEDSDYSLLHVLNENLLVKEVIFYGNHINRYIKDIKEKVRLFKPKYKISICLKADKKGNIK